MNRFALCALSLAASAALLAACGPGREEAPGDKGEIADVVERVSTSTDPEDCTRLQTLVYVEQHNFSTEDDALADCRESAREPGDDPDSVRVTNVEVDGDTASADVTYEGGALDGSTFTLGLVLEDRQWKVDRTTDIPEMNVDAFRRALVERLAELGEVAPSVQRCISDSLKQAEEEQVTAAILGGTGESLSTLFIECIPPVTAIAAQQ
jgi:hypothetical protein